MMKYFFFVVFCLLYMSTPIRSNAEQTRPAQLLSIVEELYQKTLDSTIQLHHYNDPEYNKEYRQNIGKTLENILVPVQDAELLGPLAILAWTIAFPGNAGGFDDFFFHTFYLCIKKLAETPSLENYQILKTIDCHLCLDGADSVMFREVMVRHFGEYSGMTEADLHVTTPTQPRHRDKTKHRKMSKEATEELMKRVSAQMQALIEKGELQFVDANAPRPEIPASSPKQKRIGELLTIMKDVYQYTLQTPTEETPTNAVRDAIVQRLADIYEPKQLSRIASMAWVLSSFRDTFDAQSGAVFYQTYRISIGKLAANPSLETHSALSLIHQCGLCLEGEEEEFFQEHFKSVIQHLKETGQW